MVFRLDAAASGAFLFRPTVRLLTKFHQLVWVLLISRQRPRALPFFRLFAAPRWGRAPFRNFCCALMCSSFLLLSSSSLRISSWASVSAFSDCSTAPSTIGGRDEFTTSFDIRPSHEAAGTYLPSYAGSHTVSPIFCRGSVPLAKRLQGPDYGANDLPSFQDCRRVKFGP